MTINGLSAVVEAFTYINPYLTAAHIRTFLYVAERKSCTQKELEFGLGMLKSGASRNVAFWVGNSKIGPSAPTPFLKSEINSENRRLRMLSLTPDGLKFYKRIERLSIG